MSGLSRRDLLRASAGAAAVAVPMSVLSQGSSPLAGAAAHEASTDAASEPADHASSPVGLNGPVMFTILDARSGDVSILHGTSEVVVRDRQLVARILRAARRTA